MNDSRASKQLKKLPLVQRIDKALWEKITPLITFVDVPEGESLFSAGRQSQNLYLVIDGELGLYMPYSSTGETYYLQSRKKGDTAGDFAVLNGGEHLVNAIAVRKTRIAQFPRYAFDMLVDIDPNLLAHVYDVASELSRRVTVARSYLDLFGDISHTTMENLLNKTETRHYHSGDVIFEQGDSPDGLHVVISGKLIVETRNVEGVVVRTAIVQAPETVGELALLADAVRSATVTAARESTIALLNRRAFDELIAPRADLLMQLSRLVVRRHVKNVRQDSHTTPHSNFVIIPLDSRLALRRFVHQLKSSMRSLGSVLTLDSRNFDTLYGRSGASQTPFDDPFNSAIAEWLDDKENRFDSLMYVADKSWNDWTKRCINRADRIVLVINATPSSDASIRPIEENLYELFKEKRVRPIIDLVLLHTPDTSHPRGTATWLKHRQYSNFHHIRMNDAAHFGRLSRRLRGNARGLVLSGGGARGYAHLGVQQLIEEQQLPIDYIGGSSMGGLLGAAMAMGQDHQKILSLSESFANKKALFDYTLPLASLMSSVKLTRFCRRVYKDTQIEDLWTPFFCVSSNLADGKEVIHEYGPLWKVVRSTISLPGVFSPVPTIAGDLLIDGAVLNTFPVDIMQQRLGSQASIIGVNVSHIPEQFNYYDFGTSLSGWSVLISRLNPFVETIRIPKIAETLLRATDIKSVERLNEARNSLDILIEPNVRSISLLDFKSYKIISELGYKEANSVFRQHKLLAKRSSAA